MLLAVPVLADSNIFISKPVIVQWDANGADSYKVYYWSSTSIYLIETKTNKTVLWLEKEKHYRVAVSAVSANLESALSNILFIKVK